MFFTKDLFSDMDSPNDVSRPVNGMAPEGLVSCPAMSVGGLVAACPDDIYDAMPFGAIAE